MISKSYAVASRAIAARSSCLPTAAAATAFPPRRLIDDNDRATPSSSSSSSSSLSSSSSSSSRAMSSQPKAKKHLVTHEDGVHQNMQLSKSWRSKPLFRRQGDVRFKSGLEASNLLIAEANRRDSHETEFIESVTATMEVLSPLFERNPRYAFVAKQLMEPDRFVQFRVTWMDDAGVTRMNRGFRIQYSSSLGPYEGPLHLGPHINAEMIKALGFDNVFSNALTGYDVGSSVGGSDFQPMNKSENEVQRFCQSYMTELARYVGPDIDHPTMGIGCAEKEMGYLFGQYKRINTKCTSATVPFMTQTLSHVSFFRRLGERGDASFALLIFFMVVRTLTIAHRRGWFRSPATPSSSSPRRCSRTKVNPSWASDASSSDPAGTRAPWSRSCSSTAPSR